MLDFNILNRARFQEISLPITVGVEAGASAIYNHALQGGVFCLKRAEWKYSVPGGQLDSYGWPKVPMQITIDSAIFDETSSPINLSPPALMRELICVRVTNPSTVKVVIHFVLTGIIAAPTEGNELNLTDKELLGYTMLDNSQKGMLALQEAAVDRLDESLRQMGIETNIRDHLLLSQTGNLKALLANTSLALPTSSKGTENAEDLKSLLIGDLVNLKLENESLSLDAIKAIANHLLAKGWVR